MTLNGLFTYLFGMRFIHYETYFFALTFGIYFPCVLKPQFRFRLIKKGCLSI